MGLKCRVVLLALLLVIGLIGSGCLVLGVVLRFSVTVSDDPEAFRLVEDTLFIDTAVINRHNLPAIETDVKFRLTGTMGSVRIEEVVVLYAELIDDQIAGTFEEVPPRHRVDLHLVAVGDMSKTEPVHFPLPQAIRTALADDPDSLVGRAYEFKFQLKGTGKLPVYRLRVEFESSGL